VAAMLAEIFMVRSEAKARVVEDVLPSSSSSFIPFSPRTQFTFKETDLKETDLKETDLKETDLKAKESPSEERPVSADPPA
jgi:hypothetical protein